jgi:hypothetical protein
MIMATDISLYDGLLIRMELCLCKSFTGLILLSNVASFASGCLLMTLQLSLILLPNIAGPVGFVIFA